MIFVNFFIDSIIVLFFITSIFVTFKYKFIQFRCFKEAPRILFKSDKKSSYQTFLVSLGSHIGTGNIVGVSTALIYGGSGSIIWMWIFTIFSSIFSLIENTLSLKYRVVVDGANRGGTCYYLKNGLNSGFFAFVFAVILVLTNTVLFQPIQINTISETLNISFGIDYIVIFVLLTIFTIFVIFRGTKMIVRFSEGIVPLMSIGYILICLVVIIVNIKLFPKVISQMFINAIDFKSAASGLFGATMLIGMKRSLFSNEAGLGTIPSISAMSEIKKPIEQGFVQTFGVFIDTIICTLTAFIILLYSIDLTGYEGCDLIIHIFNTIFDKFGIILSTFFMLSFAIATVVSQFYLGESNILYLVKNFKLNQKVSIIIFKILFIMGIAIGVFLSTIQIFSIIDITLIIIGTINLVSILLLKQQFEIELFEFKKEKPLNWENYVNLSKY